jgi:hypothetical protein
MSCPFILVDAATPGINLSFYGFLGRGWQRGHEKDDRFMNGSRRIAVPHRPHGSPSWP